jgi:hypothetical protein
MAKTAATNCSLRQYGRLGMLFEAARTREVLAGLRSAGGRTELLRTALAAPIQS